MNIKKWLRFILNIVFSLSTHPIFTSPLSMALLKARAESYHLIERRKLFKKQNPKQYRKATIGTQQEKDESLKNKMLAASNGQWQKYRASIIALVFANANPDAAIEGYSLLHMAALHDDFELADILLLRKAQPNPFTLSYRTPLHYASSTTMANLLHENGADVRLGMNHVTHAIQENRPTQLLRWFLDKGVEIITDESGTPLHSLAKIADKITLEEMQSRSRLLLSKKIDLNSRDYQGRTAEDMALQQRDFLLTLYNSNAHTPRAASYPERIAIVEEFLDILQEARATNLKR